MGIRRGTMTESPLVRETSKLADKNFTGSITATSGERSVSVYLRDGDVVGVSSPGFKAPEGAYVRYRTGREDLANSENPLLGAIQAYDENGAVLIDATEVGDFRRDWAYGLLASALTWDNPRITKTKDEQPPANSKIEHTQWSEVKASVDSRIQNLLMSWTTICRYLIERYTDNAPFYSASEGAAQIGALVKDSRMFTGPGESLDGVATRVGYSRYRTLRELAKILRNGGTPVRIGPYTQSGDLGTAVLVPELLEDPNNEHVTKEKLQSSIADETSDFSSVPQAELPQIEPAPAVVEEDDSLRDINSIVTFERTEGHLDDDIDDGVDFGIDLPEGEVDADPEPEVVVEPTEEQGVELDHEDFGQEITSRHEVHKLAEWAVNRDPDERELRGEILQGMILSSAQKASEGLDELDSVTDDFATVVDAQRLALAESKRAAENFARAEEVVSQRQHEASETRVWAEGVIAEEARAVRAAKSASDEVDAVREAIEEAKRVLAEREAALDPAIAEASRTQDESHVLRDRILNEVNPALAKADAAVEEAHTNLLNPATLVLGKAREAVQARTDERDAAQVRVYDKGSSVARSLEVAATMAELTPEGAEVIDPLAERFQSIRDRFGSIDVSEEDEVADVEYVSPEQVAFAEQIVDTYVEDVDVDPVFEDDAADVVSDEPVAAASEESTDVAEDEGLDIFDQDLDLGLGDSDGEQTEAAVETPEGETFDLDFDLPEATQPLPSFDEVVSPERH